MGMSWSQSWDWGWGWGMNWDAGSNHGLVIMVIMV
jgi:hypothetical protein